FLEPTAPIELYPAFLRGWFDGDGNVYIRKKKSRIIATIAGNERGLTWFAKALRKIGFRGKARVRLQETEAGRVYYLVISGLENVLELAELLKADSGLRLDRKWCGIRAIKEEKRQEQHQHEAIKKDVVSAYEHGRIETGVARD